MNTAQRLFSLVGRDRIRVAEHNATTVTAMRLFERLPEHPTITLVSAAKLAAVSKPTAGKAIDALSRAGVLTEITGRERDRVYAYREYLDVLATDTEPRPSS